VASKTTASRRVQPHSYVKGMRSNFSGAIAKARKKSGESQRDVAIRCGVSGATVRQCELGNGNLETMLTVMFGQGYTTKQIARMVSTA